MMIRCCSFKSLLRSASWLLCFVACLKIGVVQAAEVDQFTRPAGGPDHLPNSASVLESEINRLMRESVAQANARYLQAHVKNGPRWLQPRCDEDRLYQKLTDHLAQSVVGQLETFAEESPAITRRRVALEQSIYKGFFWQASPTLVLSERMAAVIRINDTEMGTDKLGHFFTEGYSYFLATDKLEKNIESALLFGEWSEAVYFGAQTTGVYSYADLVANAQGLRFWNRVLAQKPDPITGGKTKPYIVCENARWKQVQIFSWAGYVDDAWNESVNCPALSSQDLLARIRNYNLVCDTKRLPLQRYGRWSPRLLNTYGHRVLPDYLQPEIILEERVVNKDVNLSVDTLDYIADLRVRLEQWRRVSAAALEKVKP